MPTNTKSKNVEIERKFLLSGLPKEIDPKECSKKEIIQAYLFVVGDREQRIRKVTKNDSAPVCTQTIKVGKGLKREEIEFEIPMEKFDVLLRLALGKIIKKTRYELKHREHKIEVDVYHGDLKGLVVAEVEFKSERKASKFVLPSWFGIEITGNKQYSNSSLALAGLLLRK